MTAANITAATKRAITRKTPPIRSIAITALLTAVFALTLSSCAPIGDPSPGENNLEAGLAVLISQ
jgi:hypothetical protein